MKTQSLVLLGVALLGACALGQTPSPSPSAPQPQTKAPLVIEPGAQAILDRATQNYQGVSGISFHIVRTIGGRNGTRDFGSVLTRYSAPDKLDITERVRRNVSRAVSDGSNFYSVIGTQYYKAPVNPNGVSSQMGGYSASGRLVAAMMKGNNPFGEMYRMYSQLPPKDFTNSAVVALGPRIVDGDVLQGVQYGYSARFAAFPGEKPETISEQITAWFGGSPFLLRRVQSRSTLRGDTTTVGEKMIAQQLSPTFAEGTFQFNDEGLKPASNEANNQPYWDPRLKVGTAPYAFSAQGLQGEAISLEKYKGKVLLLDFWATWCGPCVEGLPEIKSAYDKYHKQGLEVVGVSSDENKKQLASFIKSRKMAWPQIFEREKGKSPVSDLYGVKAIPFLLLIGRNGKIAAVNPRGNIEAAVKAALAKG